MQLGINKTNLKNSDEQYNNSQLRILQLHEIPLSCVAVMSGATLALNCPIVK